MFRAQRGNEVGDKKLDMDGLDFGAKKWQTNPPRSSTLWTMYKLSISEVALQCNMRNHLDMSWWTWFGELVRWGKVEGWDMLMSLDDALVVLEFWMVPRLKALKNLAGRKTGRHRGWVQNLNSWGVAEDLFCLVLCFTGGKTFAPLLILFGSGIGFFMGFDHFQSNTTW